MKQTLLMVAVLGLLFYFMMIRPQAKRQREHQAAMSALVDGDRILLAGGLFCTVRHMGDKQAIVELAPGVEITVAKNSIIRAVKEDEEEFEFSDDVVVTETQVEVPDDASSLFEAPAEAEETAQKSDETGTEDEDNQDRGSANR